MSLPNEFQIGRVNRVLQRLLQIKGGAPAPVLVPELQANIILESDRPEWEYLGGGHLWWVAPSQGAVVAEFAQVGIRNPTGSNVLVVVETAIAIQFQAGTAFQAEVRQRAQGAIDATGQPSPRDFRLGVTQAVIACISLASSEAAALGQKQRGFFIPANDSKDVLAGCPVVLPPGFDLLVGPNVANLGIAVSFSGRERALESSES